MCRLKIERVEYLRVSVLVVYVFLLVNDSDLCQNIAWKLSLRCVVFVGKRRTIILSGSEVSVVTPRTLFLPAFAALRAFRLLAQLVNIVPHVHKAIPKSNLIRSANSNASNLRQSKPDPRALYPDHAKQKKIGSLCTGWRSSGM